jgi:hypothetical protein
MVDHIPEHMGAPSVLDEPKSVAAKLKIITPLVDTVGAMSLNIDSSFHIADEVVQGGGSWFEPDIRNADHRDASPTVSTIGAT